MKILFINSQFLLIDDAILILSRGHFRLYCIEGCQFIFNKKKLFSVLVKFRKIISKSFENQQSGVHFPHLLLIDRGKFRRSLVNHMNQNHLKQVPTEKSKSGKGSEAHTRATALASRVRLRRCWKPSGFVTNQREI